MATNYDVKAPEDGLKLINLLVVTKLSRFAYEKVRHPEMSDTELAESLNMRGSMYKSLKTRHDIHQRYVDTMIDILTRHGCHLNVSGVKDFVQWEWC
ncbi:hypothetical protein SARC_12406 [Sphaeroforma arctica JP610]|uniref:Uncharacterized protein n=1 Tax=Sphaeroforma arctica JP610 TaxID=667725 RepID=A0A0L0FGC2_9EUKA|nr:hypothetical protein SARC_12406 [Sphaeroforma arctica JP610]KNC75063.1 hypothetical protein SARC_12406 [Sphaeroforma arctica JP610]|eukprot:XP_014148965.1 hypothetical protein SARC_12406 [Sphaeroforma arctica JP610]